jgi:Sec-independent protein translocase protein TatA
MTTWVDYWTLIQDLVVFIGIIVGTCTLVNIARSLGEIVRMLRHQEESNRLRDANRLAHKQ